MLSALIVFAVAALLTTAVAYWALRAYRDAGGRRGRSSIAMAGVIALAGLVTYLAIGRPELPDAPFAVRMEALKHRDPRTFSADEALAVLAEAARDNPRDPLPHLYAGQVYLDTGRADQAARSFDAALRREPRLAEAMLGLGRSLVAIAEGNMTPEALATFQQAATLTNDPAPWIYQAIAAMEANNGAEARRMWGEAYARMGEDDPRREMARRMSREAGL